MTQPTRRSVATHTAWAIPTLAVGASAPAVAASIQPSIRRIFTVTVGNTSCSSNSRNIAVVSNNDSGSFFQIINATPNTSITNVMASVLVSVSGLSFTTSTGNWGPVAQEAKTYSNANVTYYRYFSKLAVPVPSAVGSTITMPRLNWTSTCTTTLAPNFWVNGRGTATINGTEQVQYGAYRSF